MEPDWLGVVAWVTLGVSFACALVILADEALLGHRQHMGVMNLVHPITALYWGPLWLWVYFRNGRRSSQKVMHREAQRLSREGADADRLKHEAESVDPLHVRPWHVANAVSHCGAGCTLGDIGGEWIVWALGPWMIAGTGILGPELVWDFPLAWGFGILFQYFTIIPMRKNLSRLGGIWQAIKVDTLSIVSFQVGMFGWMALAHYVIWRPPLQIDTSGHWLMMQIGMIAGYCTAWPVNRLLITRGIKEKMDHRTHLAGMVERAPERPAQKQRAA